MDTRRIYLDYQATTPVDPRVTTAMEPYWSTVYGNAHSTNHAFGWDADTAVEAARSKVARLIGADPDEIVFTSGATEANNLAILGIARSAPSTRRRIIISAIEHKCVIAAARAAAEEGFEVVTAPVTPSGVIDLEAFRELLDDRVALVSIMTVNNEIGTIQPIRKIAKLCRSFNVIYHTDAAQALSFFEINVKNIDIDLLSLSAHKIYGPKGMGALYVSRNSSIKPKPIIHGGGQEFGFRSGTLPTSLCIGFGEACLIIHEERNNLDSHLLEMRNYFLHSLQEAIPSIIVNGELAARHPGNLNIRFPSVEAELILSNLQPNVAASTSSACTSGLPEPSHVLRAIGLSPQEANSSIRFSFGRFTTAEELHCAVSLIKKTVCNARSLLSK